MDHQVGKVARKTLLASPEASRLTTCQMAQSSLSGSTINLSNPTPQILDPVHFKPSPALIPSRQANLSNNIRLRSRLYYVQPRVGKASRSKRQSSESNLNLLRERLYSKMASHINTRKCNSSTILKKLQLPNKLRSTLSRSTLAFNLAISRVVQLWRRVKSKIW